MGIPSTKHGISYKKSDGTVIPIKKSSTSSLYDIHTCGDREAFRKQFKQQAASSSTYVDYSGEYAVDSNHEYWIEWYDIFGGTANTNTLRLLDNVTGETTTLLIPTNLFDSSYTYTQYNTMYLYIYFHDFHLGEVKSSIYISVCFVGFQNTDTELVKHLNSSYSYDRANPFSYPTTNPIVDIEIGFDTEADGSQCIYISDGVDSSDAQLQIWRKKL